MSRVRGKWKAVLRVLARSLSLRRPRRQGIPHVEPRILALVPEGPNRLVLQAVSEDAGWALTLSDTETTWASLADRPVFRPSSSTIVSYPHNTGARSSGLSQRNRPGRT